jgi:multicomponent K+:H+ antiporter subunit D
MTPADHLAILPIVLPLAAGATMLMLDEGRQTLKAAISVATMLALLAIAVALVSLASDSPVTVYRVGNWAAPFGIVLVVDRLSAAMMLLTSTLALAALVFSLARWHRAGPRFHSLVMFLVMGVNGAFLTGDLFNLFVFFEVLLASSYGLALHGSGEERVRASLHYIVVNLAASLLFLIGASLIYGATGTLNMADLARHWQQAAPGDRVLFEVGGAILGVAFLVKAGMWPLCFWLPGAYSSAVAPAGAVFAVLTKVGVYVILRTGVLFLGADVEASPSPGTPWLVVAGAATLAFGSLGVLASQNLARLASFCVLVSSGTLLATIAIDNVALTAGALYYLVVSTLALAAFFLLVELMERGRRPGADVLAVTAEAFGSDGEEEEGDGAFGNLLPAPTALLAVAFVACAIMIAGLPPLAGFVGKFAMLSALLDPAHVSVTSWIVFGLLIASGFFTTIAMVRTGIGRFWASEMVARVRVVEIAPIVGLLVACAVLTATSGPALRYFGEAAAALHYTAPYIERVMSRP